MTASRGEPLQVGDTTVEPGERRRVEIPVARLPAGSWLHLPVEVWHGARPGPRVWLSAALHGDEIVGVPIIHRVMEALEGRELAGALLAVPIVNVFGFVAESRYLPDRRDLNRSFPGSKRGSLAARLAHLFMEEVVGRCGYGIDYHSGSDDRTNLPQIRADLEDEETLRCARAFGAPVTIHASTRDKSLRQAAAERGCHVLLYEGGEARRFDPPAVEAGVAGTLRVLRCLGMWEDPVPATPPAVGAGSSSGSGAEGMAEAVAGGPTTARGTGSGGAEAAAGGERGDDPAPPTLEARKTRWARAPRSGILRLEVELGQRVERRQRMGVVLDSFGERLASVRSRTAGVVIGVTRNPLVHRGDALVHVAETEEEGVGSA